MSWLMGLLLILTPSARFHLPNIVPAKRTEFVLPLRSVERMQNAALFLPGQCNGMMHQSAAETATHRDSSLADSPMSSDAVH